MTTTTKTTPRKSKPGKVNLSPVREIPFNKLVLSQANVRRVKGGQSIEDLAEDIANRTLLQSLAVRPIRDEDGNETGSYEVPAGGRRFRALQLLVKQKRLARTAPVPCIVREDGSGAEDSLAENVHREALHPLDQFRAFQTLQMGGLSIEDIAARFFVTPAVVRQRLRLADVSPRLLNLYAEGELTLEQLMAFTVTDDHARQEQAWETVSQHSWTRQPFTIRRLLTETAIPADDRRARFVGAEAYAAAGGIIMRDLFSEDDGGWFQDMTILERLVGERLSALAGEIKAEGWAWVEAAPDFPYGHTNGMRALTGEPSPRTDAEEHERHGLLAEIDRILGAYGEGEDLTHADERRVQEIEARLEVLDTRPVVYDPVEMARAGVFVSIAMDGTAHIERGYVRAEDEPRADAPETNPAALGPAPESGETPPVQVSEIPDAASPAAESEPEDEGLRPLSDRLVSDLTAFRTLALREALGRSPETAFLSLLHALCLSTFQPWAAESCLELVMRSATLNIQPPELAESAAAKAFEARHAEWAARLPDNPGELWGALEAMS
ncbi:ParB/RepB/Spo0J family partition protein, partial [Rhodospira trueperi]